VTKHYSNQAEFEQQRRIALAELEAQRRHAEMLKQHALETRIAALLAQEELRRQMTEQ